MEIWQLEEYLLENLGIEELLTEILKALSTQQEKDILEYIARMHDLDIEK